MDEFSKLAEAAMADQSGAAVSDLWKRVNELECWVFINQPPQRRPVQDEAQALAAARPMCSRVDGKLYVIAFTNEERATTSARDNDLFGPDAPIPILSIPRDGAAEMLCNLDGGQIDGVLFNYNKGKK